jgi:hypothetical protein
MLWVDGGAGVVGAMAVLAFVLLLGRGRRTPAALAAAAR